MTNLQNIFFGATQGFLVSLILYFIPMEDIYRFYILLVLVLVCSLIYGNLFKRGNNYTPPESKESQIAHLRWIYDRLKHVHKEDKNYDYMIRLKQIIDDYEKRKDSFQNK